MIPIQAGHVFLAETLWVNLIISQFILKLVATSPLKHYLSKKVQHCVELQLLLMIMHAVL